MKTCPYNANPVNCGFASAKYLVEGNHIEFRRQYYDSVKVDDLGELALNSILTYRFTSLEADSIDVFFQCARCLRQIIRISEDSDGYYVTMAGELPDNL